MANRVQKLGLLPFSWWIVVSAALSTQSALTMHIRISAHPLYDDGQALHRAPHAGHSAQRERLSGAADALIFAHGRARFGFV